METLNKMSRLLWLFIYFGLSAFPVVSSEFCKAQNGETPYIPMCKDSDIISGVSGQTIYLDSSGAPLYTNVECKCDLKFSATTSVTISYRAENDQSTGCGITFRLDTFTADWGCKSENLTYTISKADNNMTYIKNNSREHNWFSCLGVKPGSSQISLRVKCYAARIIYAPDEVVNGRWTNWASWTSCSQTCGTTGTRTRTRTCSNPKPMNGGLPCEGLDVETEMCMEQACPVDGLWGAWSGWGLCTRTCGGGTHNRYRECNNPAPQNWGKTCAGDSFESESCNTQLCPVDGMWGAWFEWNTCSRTCGLGTQVRYRECNNPAAQNGGKTCAGISTQAQSCNIQLCPVDGIWGAWSGWSTCTRTCGEGTQDRYRVCNNPAPQNGGQTCAGDSIGSQTCNTQICSVDGGWSHWSSWGLCTVSCGSNGLRAKTRTCTNPSPLYGGLYCTGDATQSEPCGDVACPVPGGWGGWSIWSQCSHSCGSGTRQRTRICESPFPQYGGENCIGMSTLNEGCSISACPVDGSWGPWNTWVLCSTTCGSGVRTRSRSCDSPKQQNGGNVCFGDSFDTQSCTLNECPLDGNWGPWLHWSSCSKTCGEGTVSRNRLCNSPSPQNGGNYCPGTSDSTGLCTIVSCPLTGNWGPWSPWSLCSITCGEGTVSRIRFCDNLEPGVGGNECEGRSDEEKMCVKDACPVDGGFGPWSPWSTCSKSCGSGLRSRRRLCDNPSPRNGGKNCSDLLSERGGCNENECPVDNVSTVSSSTTSPALPVTDSVVDVLSASSNIGAIVGGILGGLLFLLLLILIIICLARRSRRKKEAGKRRPSEGPRSIRYVSTGDDVVVTENELYNYDGETPSQAVNALFVGGIPETPNSPGYIPHFSTDTGDRYAVIMDSTRMKHNRKDRPQLQTFAPVKRNANNSNGDVQIGASTCKGDIRASLDTVKLAENYSDDTLGVGVENPGYDGNYLAPYVAQRPKYSSTLTSPYDYIDSNKLKRDDEEFNELSGDYARLPEDSERDNPANFTSADGVDDDPDSERYKKFISSEPEDDGYLTSPIRDTKFTFPDMQ